MIQTKNPNPKFLIELMMNLSEKWKIASMVWHTEKERDILKQLLNTVKISGKSVCDVACGTGFHSILLSNMNYNVIAADVDEDNISYFQNIIDEQNYTISLYQADWQNIDEIITNKFNAVLCLGSSITYFESWNQNSKINLSNRKKGLTKILANFKNMIANNGAVIIGYSKHYPTNKSYEVVKFPDKDGYKMQWKLSFDWENKIKHWNCILKDPSGKDLSFELESHLYSKEEFINICQYVFDNVEAIDIDKDYYDEFIICS